MRYSSKRRAAAQIRVYRKQGRLDDAPMNVYKCPGCKHWHIGHHRSYAERERRRAGEVD